jgi:heme-degrading monooxygenase HmoA
MADCINWINLIWAGASPGIASDLPGEKVAEDISKTRMIPKGTDALSPALSYDTNQNNAQNNFTWNLPRDLVWSQKDEEVENMAVRIIIDRKVKKGKESDFAKILRELRSKAIPSKGYISGETLRAQDDPHNYIVITTWQSVEDWKAWEKNLERKKIQAKIEKLMARPTKTKIYLYA